MEALRNTPATPDELERLKWSIGQGYQCWEVRALFFLVEKLTGYVKHHNACQRWRSPIIDPDREPCTCGLDLPHGVNTDPYPEPLPHPAAPAPSQQDGTCIGHDPVQCASELAAQQDGGEG